LEVIRLTLREQIERLIVRWEQEQREAGHDADREALWRAVIEVRT
jgi:hypothetical protein